MSNTREFYAWVKLLDSTEAQPISPALSVQDAAAAEEMNKWARNVIFSGHRPPGGGALEPLPRGVYRFYDSSSKTTYLRIDPLQHGDWDVDPSFIGSKGQQFQVQHFVGTRDEAIAWMGTRDGVRWRGNALNIGLLRFESPPLRDAAQSAEPVPVPEPRGDDPSRQSGAVPDPCRVFAERDWRYDYLAFIKESSPLFSEQQLAELKLDDPAQFDVKAECLQVAEAVRKHQADRLEDIRKQSSDIRALARVIDPDDHGFEKPATLALMDLLRRGLRRPIFQLKWQYQRGRPWNCCAGVNTALQPGDSYFPAHAAYPSGHATLAHVAALLMSKAVPSMSAGYAERAQEVAENRIIGGFHWPSDNCGGEQLAHLLLPLLQAHPKVRQLLADVAKEW